MGNLLKFYKSIHGVYTGTRVFMGVDMGSPPMETRVPVYSWGWIRDDPMYSRGDPMYTPRIHGGHRGNTGFPHEYMGYPVNSWG